MSSTLTKVSRQIVCVTSKGCCKTKASVTSRIHKSAFLLSFSSMGTREEHLTRTSSNKRDREIHSMKVKATNILSPTIKEIVLVCENFPVSFTFKAGQWVDVFIPNVEVVGGFSMCSGPQELKSHGILRLGVKFSTHPPALWMHKKCQIGDTLSVRVGGDFHWTGRTRSDDGTLMQTLLIAGGVGINPLLSMIHYAMDENLVGPGAKMCLLYSAKTKQELVFKETLDTYSKMNPNFIVKYFVTDKKHYALSTGDENLKRARISAKDLEDTIIWLNELNSHADHNTEAFICGPPPMIEEVSDALKKINLKSIHFEKWW